MRNTFSRLPRPREGYFLYWSDGHEVFLHKDEAFARLQWLESQGVVGWIEDLKGNRIS